MNHLNINIEKYEIDGTILLGPIHTIINSDDRIAIVGRNGIGKSTFMKILTGEIIEYHGTIDNIGGITVGYLEQIQFMDETKSIRDELKDAFEQIRALERTIQDEEAKLEITGEYDLYTESLEQYRLLGGYTYENEVEKVARGIGVFHLLERKLSEVSGGERTKIALAKVLLSKPDFLLLDEPTNFIDLSSVEWLEKYLEESWKGGYMIISHDREFLDRTCSKVIEVLGPLGIELFYGDYSYSVREKEAILERKLKAYEEQRTEFESEKALINRFRAGSRASFAKSRERALEKVELLEKPLMPQVPSFTFEIPKERPPEMMIRAEDVFIGRKEPLFYIRQISLRANERIGIVGENGAGKSTFLKTLLDTIPVLEGYLDLARNIKVGYYSQLHESLDTEKTIRENFHLHGLMYTTERIGGIIGKYNFSYHDTEKKVKNLSGGERSRLLFSILGQNPYDLLILDEPTNHLDYESRESLERALRKYEGTILFISHDRYFVNKLAEKLWIIDRGEMIVSYGNYEDYRYKKERGLSLDMSLFDADGEMNLVLEEKLGREEAKRIREKFARRKK